MKNFKNIEKHMHCTEDKHPDYLRDVVVFDTKSKSLHIGYWRSLYEIFSFQLIGEVSDDLKWISLEELNELIS